MLVADLSALDFRWRTFRGLEGLRSLVGRLGVESSGEHDVEDGGKTVEWSMSEVALLPNALARFDSSRGFLDVEDCLRGPGRPKWSGSEGMEMVSEPE